MDADHDAALRARFQELLEAAAGNADADVPPFTSVRARAGRRRTRRRAMGGLTVVIAISAGIFVATDQNDARELDTVGPSATELEPDPSPTTTLEERIGPGLEGGGGPAVTAAAAVPLDVRGDAAIEWTGDELVVWGGDVEAFNMGLPGADRSYADGAAYDPETDRWRPLPQAPLPATADTPVATMTDAGLVIARGSAVALLERDGQTWAQLPDAPAPVQDLHGTGTGAISSTANARLDSVGGEWRWTDLPDPLFAFERPAPAMTSRGLVVVGGPDSPFAQIRAQRYDADADAWVETSPPPDGITGAAVAADWDGRRVIVVSYDMDAAAYDPVADEWSRLPSVPARSSEHYPSVHSTPVGTVAVMAQASPILLPNGRWVPLPSTSASSIATDGVARLFSLSVDRAEARNQLTVTRLDLLAAAPATLQVGSGAVPVPEGYSLAESAFETDFSQYATVRIELSGPDGACEVTSTYTGMAEPSSELSEEEELSNDGVPTLWWRSPDERSWSAPATTSDRFEITCDASAAARTLASGASFGFGRE